MGNCVESAPIKSDEDNPFESVKERFRIAAHYLELEPGRYNFLITPAKQGFVPIPIQMDGGDINIYEGERVIHNQGMGSSKGGVRYAPDVTLNDVKTLAVWMTWKCAPVNVPLTGAKGDVKVEPNSLTTARLEKITHRYTAKKDGLSNWIGAYNMWVDRVAKGCAPGEFTANLNFYRLHIEGGSVKHEATKFN